MNTEPNQSLEPTTIAVTPRAFARVAPAILNLIVPSRRRFRNQFGGYVAPELIERMRVAQKDPEPEILRVIYFGCPSWGFTDRALPKLKEFLSKTDTDILVTSASITIRCFGERSKADYDRLLSELERFLEDTDFEGFRISTAEGMQSSYIDIGRIVNQAMLAQK